MPPGCSGRDLGRVAFVTGAAPAPDVHDQQLGSRDRLLLALLLSAVRVLERLPDGIVYRGAAGIGLLCYLAMPGRRSVVREPAAGHRVPRPHRQGFRAGTTRGRR